MSAFDLNHLEKALAFLDEKDRENVIDAVYCELHNTWGTLQGNTAESDVKWFARWLCAGVHPRGYEWLDEYEQHFWDNLAEQCLRGLPMLLDRMVSRYHTYRDVIDIMRKSDWVAQKEAEKQADTARAAGESGVSHE